MSASEAALDGLMALAGRERPDFVEICTRPESHLPLVRLAAENGAHVLCQKPAAPTLDALREMITVCVQARVRFMVHENWRWQPWYREIKRIQSSGAVGDFTHIHFLTRTGDGWQENAYLDRQPFFREYPRLLVYETGVHFIDTFRYMLGEVTEVYAHLRRLNPAIRGEETGQLFFRFVGGATAIWDANRYNEVEAASPRLTFGQMRIDAMGGHITLDTEANLRVKRLGQPGYDVVYPHDNLNFAGDCVYALQRRFVDAMASGEDFEANGDDYLRTLVVVDAVYQSASRGEVVRL